MRVNEPLILAAIRGDNQKVNSLLAGGADVNALGRGKTTALMMAASEGSVDGKVFQNPCHTFI